MWPEAAVEHCDRQHGAGGAVAHDAGQPLCLAGHMHVTGANDRGVWHISSAAAVAVGGQQTPCGTLQISMLHLWYRGGVNESVQVPVVIWEGSRDTEQYAAMCCDRGAAAVVTAWGGYRNAA